MVPLLVLTPLAGGFMAARLAARRRAAVHPSFRSVAKGLVAVGLILLGLGSDHLAPEQHDAARSTRRRSTRGVPVLQRPALILVSSVRRQVVALVRAFATASRRVTGG